MKKSVRLTGERISASFPKVPRGTGFSRAHRAALGGEKSLNCLATDAYEAYSHVVVGRRYERCFRLLASQDMCASVLFALHYARSRNGAESFAAAQAVEHWRAATAAALARVGVHPRTEELVRRVGLARRMMLAVDDPDSTRVLGAKPASPASSAAAA